MTSRLGRIGSCFSIAAALYCFLPLVCAAAEPTDRALLNFFENEIRPLLADQCVQCHGPRKSESNLRLDRREEALRGGDSGPAVVPGNAAASLLIQAVRHEGDLAMPPDARLANEQIAALVRWIDAGAVWPEGAKLGEGGPALRGGAITPAEREFWAFQPLADPAPPAVHDARPIRNDIDRFVHARLAAAGLAMRSPADKRTLLRRVTFDVTGLPPTPEELAAFEQDGDPGAFARVVERLLASPAYGERWGRHWLDVVRYADTAGETADYPTPLAFKYRNWVIHAVNADLPYDEFVRQQLAGDILARELIERARDAAVASGADPAGWTPPPELLADYADMLTAAGFIAISRRFGFDVENYHHLTIQDTIDVVGQSMLGLTLGCARCHDHKYDPVNMTDYYAWYGIFASTKYSFPGSEEKKRPYDLFPALPPEFAARRQAEHAARVSAVEADIQEIERQKQQAAEKLRTAEGYPAYLAERRLKLAVKDEGGYAGLHAWKNDPLPLVAVNTADAALLIPGAAPPKSLVVHPNPQEGVGIAWRSPIEGKVQIAGRVRDAHDCGDSVAWHLDKINAAGFEAVSAGAVERNGEQRLASAESGAEQPLAVSIRSGDYLQLVISPKTNHGCDLTQVEWTIAEVEGERRTWNLTADVLDDLLAGNPNDDQYGHAETWHFFVSAVDRGQAFGGSAPRPLPSDEAAALQTRLSELNGLQASRNAELAALQQIAPNELIYGAAESDTPQDARIQLRGERDKFGDTAPRKNLDILGNDPLPPDAGSGRKALAAWITRDENPLFARVMVNRIWQQHFGRGLVGTANDFGARGELPSHPELLDWLACRFRESGYSLKSMHRLITASAAYQQSSAEDAAAAEQDPEARLLWRFNRRRLSAEEIRDAMLHVSGNLDSTMGAAHPFPPVDTWGFTQHAPFYGVYPTNQRSVYLMQQRLKRHPFLALFDGPDTNVSTPRRELTTVPTQALYLMNNEFVHEQAAGLARRALAIEAGATEKGAAEKQDGDLARLELLWRHALCRAPSTDEAAEAGRFLVNYQMLLAENGVSAADAELRSWYALARTLLSRNEFLFVD